MNNQIELNDEQLELVTGGSAFFGSQSNDADVYQTAVAVVAASPATIFGGSHNTIIGPNAVALNASRITQINK